MNGEPGVFAPSGILRDPHLQSLLASLPPRTTWVRLRGRALERDSVPHVIDCGGGVRLDGLLTPTLNGRATKGLVLTMHGWEGSVHSAYLVSLARHLRSRDFAVFRLNFRDHGDSHHLNEGLFHSCRLSEVVGAAGAIARRFPIRPFFVVGFSLGGSFALRLGLRAPSEGLPLDGIVAVSPVVDPPNVLAALESGPRFYERHFVRKWSRSLRRKERLFPHLYDFREWLRLRDLREQTGYLVRHHTGFAGLDDYLHGYSIARSRLAGLRIPATIVTASDDPIVPIEDVHRLAPPDCLRIEIQKHGGHCGFIEDLTLRSWIDARIASILERYPVSPAGSPGSARDHDRKTEGRSERSRSGRRP